MTDAKDWVTTQSLGDGRGIMVSIGKAQLREAGLDPDRDLEVNRYVFDGSKEIRLRFRQKED